MFPLVTMLGDSDDALVFAVPIVAIVCTFAWLIVKALVSPFANRSDPPNGKGSPYRRWRSGPGGEAAPAAGGLSEEEQAILRRLQQTLVQMERRIESLETILIDQSRTNEKYGTKL